MAKAPKDGEGTATATRYRTKQTAKKSTGAPAPRAFISERQPLPGKRSCVIKAQAALKPSPICDNDGNFSEGVESGAEHNNVRLHVL